MTLTEVLTRLSKECTVRVGMYGTGWYDVRRDNVVVRTLGSQLIEPGFESSWCHFEAFAILFIPLCHS